MKLFLFAGEMSADLYGRRIVLQLQKLLPPFTLIGVGGPHLQQCGQKQLLSMEEFQTMGFSDVLKRLPQLLNNMRKVRNEILSEQPDLVLFIDQPSLSMRVAKSLRKKDYKGPIVQFVAPTVWAYNPGRADEMAESFDLLLTLFDFEPKYFSHTKLKTIFVGHPIVEIIKEAKEKQKMISFSQPVLSIFPGSRPDEVKRNLPRQLQAAKLVKGMFPELEIVVSGRDISFEDRYELMQQSALALAKSGTVNLELALHNVPTVVTYELTLLNRLIATYFLNLKKMPYYSIANIVCGRQLFPEVIRPPVSASLIAKELCALYTTPRHTSGIVESRLYDTIEPSERIAKELCEFL